ncbi:uncharacterized protein LOC134668330 [Cydia fagiglandana]|uniref:uncharacterized protein LOC134668330 n=1 Tax=Cydia fagiglandana TaxID=1458189 RepID=UPI002FEE2EA4
MKSTATTKKWGRETSQTTDCVLISFFFLNEVLKRDNTPIKTSDSGNASADVQAPSPAERQHENVAEELRLFRSEFRAARDDIAGLRHEVAELRELITGYQARFEAVEERVKALEEQSQERASGGADYNELAGTVAALKQELSDRDQDLLLSDLEIAGVPEHPNENPSHLTSLIAQKLGVSLDERDVVFAERVGPRRLVPAASGTGGEASSEAVAGRARPRPLVVRLARRGIRGELLRAARTRRGVDTSGFGLPGEARRFYVNERLTRLNRSLLYSARQECKRLEWRYSWTKDGRVYVRRKSGDAAHRIKSEDDIGKVFG